MPRRSLRGDPPQRQQGLRPQICSKLIRPHLDAEDSAEFNIVQAPGSMIPRISRQQGMEFRPFRFRRRLPALAPLECRSPTRRPRSRKPTSLNQPSSRPLAINRRIASGRDTNGGPSAAIHASKRPRSWSCNRTPTSVPVASARFLRVFVLSLVDLAMLSR